MRCAVAAAGMQFASVQDQMNRWLEEESGDVAAAEGDDTQGAAAPLDAPDDA